MNLSRESSSEKKDPSNRENKDGAHDENKSIWEWKESGKGQTRRMYVHELSIIAIISVHQISVCSSGFTKTECDLKSYCYNKALC